MNKTYGEVLREARDLLKSRKILEADIDAWYLMSEVTGFSRIDFWDKGKLPMPEDQFEHFEDMIQKRAEHIPLQYIIGYQEFCGLRFEVNENVLIPRQDTEILVEKVLGFCKGKTVLDMCTGSGCILISLAVLGGIRSGVGVDISEKALEVAGTNAANNGLSVIELVQSNLFERVDGSFDIIVSNPPYIASKEIDELMSEVKDHEPRLALDGSDDGLEFYRSITNEAVKHLNPDGYLVYEIGCEQKEAVMEIMQKAGFKEVVCYKDLADLDRVVIGRYLHEDGY